MVITPLVALWIAIAVGVLVLLAESCTTAGSGGSRTSPSAPTGRPAAWTAIASPLRVFAAAAATWGLLVLASADPRCGRRRRPGKRPDTC